MYIVIIGAGRLGRSVAMEFIRKGNEVVIIDKDINNLNELRNFDGEKIRGVEYDNDVLLEAGIDKADVFLALTPDDNINIIASRISKEVLGVKKVISRVSNTSMKPIYMSLGIETISPISLAVEGIKGKVSNMKEITNLSDEISIFEIVIARVKLSSIGSIQRKFNCIISSLTRSGITRIITGEEILQKGDKIVCTIKNEYKDKLIKELSKGDALL